MTNGDFQMARRKYTSDIFVSYATEDLDRGVSEIFMALYETGITSTWIDRLVIKPGDSIPEKIDEGINSTRYLLPVVTQTYFNKLWTRSELDAVRMLSKPAIPIWIDVNPKQVGKFSPTLAAQKAIIYESNPYEVAEQVGSVLLNNKRTHFYKNKDSREKARIFWQACYLYVLDVVNGKDISTDELWNSDFSEPDSTGATMKGNVEEAIDLDYEEMLSRAQAYRKKAEELGNEIANEDIAHLICGEIKRRTAWFPHEPREHLALGKVGVDRF
ncbi:toll/interleukin-1 receptor domain-containing protein [Plasticicumulans sp.]|uniref:toll/interleukin-1 receptor domain-containing protein n=1 Tax=Plasticicumulans sp. TaxID=2307179 RepID=UPI00321FE4BE